MNIGQARFPLRILWSSNGPHTPTGYGQQTALFTPRLAALGHRLGIFSWYGLQGGALNYTGVHEGQGHPMVLYPQGRDGYGNDMVMAHATQHKADIVISLIDTWVLDPAAHGGPQKWCPWFPVDGAPISPRVLNTVRQSLRPIVYSRFGERMCHDAGLDVAYVPHGVDTAAYCPGDQRAARAALKLDPDAFWVLMVAANKDNPSRKAFPQVLEAFAHFARRHGDARLYLHTFADGGTDLHALADALGIRHLVTFANQYQMITGGAPTPHMANLYRAADVLINPALGEGFGLPILEAQACGTPAIVGKWSAMEELCFSGYAISPPADAVPGYGHIPDHWWHMGEASWYVPRVGQILCALEALWELRLQGNTWARMQADARAGAMAYDADLVARDYWRPVLDDIGERIGVAPAPADDGAYLDMRNPAHWSPTGLYGPDGGLYFPARDPKSAAALCWHPERPQQRRIVPDGWGLVAGGIPLDIDDDPAGGVAKIVCKEITAAYGLDDLDLQPGDVAIDLGAQVGVVSCYLARRFPSVTIHAVEAQPRNVQRLDRNLRANGVAERVIVWPVAVTGDGRQVLIKGDLSQNSGGSDIYRDDGPDSAVVASVTLNDIARGIVGPIALLKVDIEGAEYEVLRAAPDVLRRVDVIAIEVHARPGEDGGDLIAWLCSLGCEVRVNGKRFKAVEEVPQ